LNYGKLYLGRELETLASTTGGGEKTGVEHNK